MTPLRCRFAAGSGLGGGEFEQQLADGFAQRLLGQCPGSHLRHSPGGDEEQRGDGAHAEAVRVTFDTSKVSYETLARLFFEIHDPTQIDRQGPDIGDQYRSEIFYTSPEQRAVAERLIALLRSKGYRVATRVTPAGPFWPAETCHQDYYRRRGTLPYCHAYTRRF